MSRCLTGVKDGEPVVVAANFLIDAESNLKAAVGGFGHASHGSKPKPEAGAPADEHAAHQAAKPAAAVGHQAEGTVEAFDAKAGTDAQSRAGRQSQVARDDHGVPVADAGAVERTQTGLRSVAFEFVERKPGEWVVTSIKPMAGTR
jgi:Cu(I)/Ag(I) efflux system membrane fusion protein